MNVTNMLLTDTTALPLRLRPWWVGLGAGRPARRDLVVKICLRMAWYTASLLIIILAGFNGPIAGIFSENPLVLTNARTAMVIVAVAAMPDAVTVVYRWSSGRRRHRFCRPYPACSVP